MRDLHCLLGLVSLNLIHHIHPRTPSTNVYYLCRPQMLISDVDCQCWLRLCLSDPSGTELSMVFSSPSHITSDYQDGITSWKWSSRWTGLSKWPSGWTSLLQMIMLIDQPLTNDQQDRLAPCKWLFRWTGLLQMIIRMDPSLNIILIFLLCSSFAPQTQNSRFKNHRSVYS